MRLKVLVSAALFALAAPALAQQNATILDTSGGTVGTILRVDGDHYIVRTDKHEVRLPVTSFTKTDTGYLFGMTQAALNAQVDAALAEAQAKMVAGATVLGSAGGTVGTIEALDAEFVTVKLASGKTVRLPRASVAATPQGPVIGVTAAELEAQASAAAEPAPQG